MPCFITPLLALCSPFPQQLYILNLLFEADCFWLQQGGGPKGDSTIRIRQRKGLEEFCRVSQAASHPRELPGML